MSLMMPCPKQVSEEKPWLWVWEWGGGGKLIASRIWEKRLEGKQGRAGHCDLRPLCEAASGLGLALRSWSPQRAALLGPELDKDTPLSFGSEWEGAPLLLQGVTQLKEQGQPRRGHSAVAFPGSRLWCLVDTVSDLREPGLPPSCPVGVLYHTREERRGPTSTNNWQWISYDLG